MRQSLSFAKEYYDSDFAFINGVIEKNEVKSNPKFVEFGLKLNHFIIKMSDGLLSASASYGMIRWSLGALSNYIKADQETGISYASTQYNLVTTLSERDVKTGEILFPDMVNGEVTPSDVQCAIKIRHLKQLAQQSEKEMMAVGFLNPSVLPVIIPNIESPITTSDNHILYFKKIQNLDGSATFSDLRYEIGKKIYHLNALDSYSYPEFNNTINNTCITLGYKSALKNQVIVDDIHTYTANIKDDGTLKAVLNNGLSLKKLVCVK